MSKKECKQLCGNCTQQCSSYKPEPKPDRKGTVFIGKDRKITGWRFEGE